MQEKLNEIWNDFHGKLQSLVNGKISNSEDASDVLQEIFLKIYKNIDKIETLENLQSWINKIARNTIIDYYKKAKILTTNIDNMEIPDEQILDDSFNSEISLCLAKLIQKLNSNDEQIIDKAHFESMKHKQIASQLNISEANSKMKFSRAKKKLKDKLLGCCDFEVDKYGNIISYIQKNKCDCG